MISSVVSRECICSDCGFFLLCLSLQLKVLEYWCDVFGTNNGSVICIPQSPSSTWVHRLSGEYEQTQSHEMFHVGRPSDETQALSWKRWGEEVDFGEAVIFAFAPCRLRQCIGMVSKITI